MLAPLWWLASARAPKIGHAAPRTGAPARPSGADGWRIFWMGFLGFSVAYGCANWGLERSTVTNAALLIIVEPIAVITLSPRLLGERLSRREAAGAAVALLGTVVVVVNGIPGITERIAPHWQGDLLLVTSGLAFASYSLIGRSVLARRPAIPVTVTSVAWGGLALVPVAAIEWLDGRRLALTSAGTLATLHLGVVISAFGYVVWNYALARVPAPRAAIFLTVQPIAGALLGITLFDEPMTAFTAVGGALTVTGLVVTLPRSRPVAAEVNRTRR